MAMTSLLSKDDLHLFNEGSHLRLYQHLGAHLGNEGTWFAVWAPNARIVNVIGNWNGWDKHKDVLELRGDSGVWEGFVPGVGQGATYKFHIEARNGYRVDKADPLAFRAEQPPHTASVVWDLGYRWGDSKWMHERSKRGALDAPISIYELHLGSWRRVPEEKDRPLTYRELAAPLCEYLGRLGFTHVEFLPVMEHPFYGSWGYQTTGYFAPTSRYGTPQDLMYLIDQLHQAGIGVILDWVPSHFPSDEMGLAYFDGTHLYEHADPRLGFHPDWNTYIFNYGRHEVRSFLLSSAMFWLDRYHADGLRVDAVASMLYLDYSRKQGEWIPNLHGGRENLEAISFLQRLNTEVYGRHPGAQTYAEESTSWPGVSRPIYLGGLGFGFKWDMGWMHDTLYYLERDPVHRRFHHQALTFRAIYAFHENFVLPLSHDEVVHGKGSLLGKMAGNEWEKRANLRLLFCNQWSQPGKKLLFMGGELGQGREWNHESSLDWHLTSDARHAGIQRLVADLNDLYAREPALHALDTQAAGFEWVDANDSNQSVASYLRKDGQGGQILVVLNYTPVIRAGYRVGVPRAGEWREVLNSDAAIYGGSGVGNYGAVHTRAIACHGRGQSLELVLPPLGALFLKPA
ncbi:MAG: 1,4-alpha-glucan branching protein GlgB [Deltaproteobacteria bacterium]|nr:MAG: 1,4-alpha-glucan branching protein GlgB [Deltaproteobacteria bacterium]